MKKIVVGPGRLYLAPLSETMAVCDRYDTGMSDQNCTLVFEERVHTATDEAGRAVAWIPYGASASFSGVLVDFDPDVIARLFHIAPPDPSGRMYFGDRQASAEPLQMVFVQQLPQADGTRLVIRMRGVCTSGFSMSFSGKSESAINFEIRSVYGESQKQDAFSIGWEII